MSVFWIVLIVVGGFCILVAYASVVVGARSDKDMERAVESRRFTRKMYGPIVGDGYNAEKLRQAMRDDEHTKEDDNV